MIALFPGCLLRVARRIIALGPAGNRILLEMEYACFPTREEAMNFRAKLEDMHGLTAEVW